MKVRRLRTDQVNVNSFSLPQTDNLLRLHLELGFNLLRFLTFCLESAVTTVSIPYFFGSGSAHSLLRQFSTASTRNAGTMSESPEPRLDSPALDKDENEEDVTLDKERDIAADISDDESVLSDVDEEQFKEFDPADIPLDDRPALAIDEENLKLVGRHKRRRTEEDGEGQTKKKKKEGRRDKKSHRKKQGSEEFSGGEEMDGKRRRKRREGGGEKAPRQSKKQVEEEIDEESLDPATSKLYSTQRKR